MKLGTIIKVIASCGYEGQGDIREFVGKEFAVAGHWKQKGNDDFNKGDILIMDKKGLYLLNNKEYIIVEK